MPKIKWQYPGENQFWCALRFIVLSRSRNGRLLVVLVILRCVHATEATMETARLVEEDGREVNTSVGCKPDDKSAGVTP